ncbi:hypothetical protein LCGC14_0603890 [marine sediment metagenome]|uniref:Uncharacterized protein n=1 Tax=marine sediment metagenome TaxID=412755 RepID=A0A0F9REK6_9ZZZZ
MSGPATPFERLLQHIIAGEAVSAGVTNRAPQQLGRRTQYLFDRLQLLAAGEALFYHDVNLEVAALVGHVVYYNPTTDQYERAIAAVDYNPAAGWFEIAPSSFVVGMVYSKTANDRGSILTVGALRDFDLANTIDDPTVAGPYYLSMTTPGKLTQFKPPVSVFTLYNRGDDSFHFYPTPRDVLEDHVHYRYHLFAQPAGDHNCIEIADDDVHRVLNPDANLPGWLPADHPSFAGVAPAGAKFGYNLAKHPELQAVWPPTPADASHVERNGKGVPSNGAVRPTVLVDANGLWWFDNCYGAAPWPPGYPDCFADSSSSPESSLSSVSGVQWDCLTPPEYMPDQAEQGLDQMVLVLWFTKMVFKTDDTVVTSLDPRSETEPISVLDCDGEPGSTGKLCLAFDWSKLQEVYPSAGFKGVKNLAQAKILRGPLVTGVKPGLRAEIAGIGTEDEDWAYDDETGLYHGNLQIGLQSVQDVSEGLIDLVAFNNVREEYDDVEKLFYFHFPSGRQSSFRGRIHLPRINMTASATPDQLKLYLWFWFLSRQAGSSAVPTLIATYRRYPRPVGVQALPVPSAEQDIDTGGEWDPSIAFTAAKQYAEAATPALDAYIGDTIFFTVGWAGIDPPALSEGFGIMRLGYRIELVP